jgi:hypothetical protein
MDEDLGNYSFRIYLQLRKMRHPQMFQRNIKAYLDKRKTDAVQRTISLHFNPFLASLDRLRWQQQCTANSKNISHREPFLFYVLPASTM